MESSTPADPATAFVELLASRLTGGGIELVAFPETALRLRRVLDDPDSELSEVLRLVSAEPVIAARLMKVANSAAMRTGGAEITDLKRAIVRIGNAVVRNAVMHFAAQQVAGAVSDPGLRGLVRDAWRHSARVAAIAYVLAREQNRVNPDTALLGGLLHDIGRFYILAELDAHPDLAPDAQAVDDIVRDWHSGVGQAILESWDLPEELCKIAGEHDALEREHFGLPDCLDVVIVANLLEHAGEDTERLQTFSTLPPMRCVGLDAESGQRLLQRSAKAIESLSAALT